MRISAVEEYGLRCLLALARIGSDGQLSIADIAEMEGLSVPYASKLLALLRREGLVVAERGRGGGFSIASNPADISMYQVITALGGPLIDPHHCTKFSGQQEECVHIANCTVHDVLGGLAGYIQEFLSQTSLADLVNQDKVDYLKRMGSFMLSDRALETELRTVDAPAAVVVTGGEKTKSR
jgi:Rrf2 family protein